MGQFVRFPASPDPKLLQQFVAGILEAEQRVRRSGKRAKAVPSRATIVPRTVRGPPLYVAALAELRGISRHAAATVAQLEALVGEATDEAAQELLIDFLDEMLQVYRRLAPLVAES